jgi:hypothetical protein
MSKKKKGKGKAKAVRSLGSVQMLKKEAANPGMYFAGLLLSAFAGKAIDKVLPVAANPEGKFQVKAIIKPLVLAAAGTGVAIVGKKKEHLRYLGYGIATGGVVCGVKVILKKDPFGGLGSLFGDDLQAMMDNIQANPQWLASVKAKAITNGNSLEDQIRLDAQWMLDQGSTAGMGASMPLKRRVINAEIFRENAETQRQLLRQNEFNPELEEGVNGLLGLGTEEENLLGLSNVQDADYQILGLDVPGDESIL